MTSLHPLLQEPPLSLKTERLAHILATTENLLIIQDLDGVCMGLVNDPLTRQIDLDYVRATQAFDGHFYVLTNGEHGGRRGINGIIERAVAAAGINPTSVGYLPGLAAGGVQWQDRDGRLSHPGVQAAELAFLAAVPARMQTTLAQFCDQQADALPAAAVADLIAASVLDNQASPSVNLNSFYAYWGDASEERRRDHLETYQALQQVVQDLLLTLLQEAAAQGLGDSFFVHYAPNWGRDAQGQERLKPAQAGDAGTTDFQFMLRGALKEAGVLALLNRYYGRRTGVYPLGEGFSVRDAPRQLSELLALAIAQFDPAPMPLLVGVGDTVTSQVVATATGWEARRGGSDRNFLELIQALDRHFQRGNLVVYIDSSGGEVKNRRPITVAEVEGEQRAIAGPGDPRDTEDPLVLDVVLPGGHRQYLDLFCQAAQQRAQIHPGSSAFPSRR